MYVSARSTLGLATVINQQKIAVRKLSESGVPFKRNRIEFATTQIGTYEHDVLCAVARAAYARRQRQTGVDVGPNWGPR
jgi:hypothetical protein